MKSGIKSKPTWLVGGLVGALFLVVPLVLAACGGGDDKTGEVQIIEKEVQVEVVREVPVEVEVIREVPVEVEKEVIVEKTVEKIVEVIATPAPVMQEGFVFRSLDPFPKYGGTLRTAYGGPGAHFDHYASFHTVPYFRLVYDNLVRRDPRDVPNNMPIVPELATSWEISTDGLTYTFHLRDGVEFHDGTPLTAADVKATYDRIIFPESYGEGLNSIEKSLFEAVSAVNVVNPLTVEFKLGEARAIDYMMQLIGVGYNMINRKADLDSMGGDLATGETLPGTGPFTQGLRTTESWTFNKHPDYWNADVPYVDAIEQIELGGWSAERVAALLGGLVDHACCVTNDAFDTILSRPDMAGVTWSWGTPYHFFGLNASDPVLGDPKVMRAIHLLIDKQAVPDIVNVYGPADISGIVFDPRSPYGTRLDQLVKTLPYDPNRRDEAIAKAKELVAEAGYADGFPRTYQYPVRVNPQFIALAEMFQAVVKEHINMDIELQVLENPVHFERNKQGDFDFTSAGCGGLTTDPASYLRTCFGVDKVTGEPAGQNFYGYNNAELNDLITQFEEEVDPEKRFLIGLDIERVIEEAPPVNMAATSDWYWGWHTYVRGVSPIGGIATNDNWKFDYVWLDR